MSQVSVSVILPTFNRRDSLRVTLDGLAQQDLAAIWEAVIVSDGSTDGTAEMVREYQKTAPFSLRFIEQTNAGPARARNRGIQEASGEIIVFIDDDVEPFPTFLSRHFAHHETATDQAVIGPMLPDPKRRSAEPVWIAWEHAMLEKQYRAWRTGEWKGVGAHHFYSGNASLRREHLEAVGGFNETFGRQEDVELAVRLETERGIQFCYDADAIGIHRPLRSFAGWLKVPFAYGSLDVTRAKNDGGRTWERVQHGYHSRNRATRLIADICLAFPTLSLPLRTALLGAAQSLYTIHQDSAALAALSVLYNVHYLEGAASVLGSSSALYQILAKKADCEVRV